MPAPLPPESAYTYAVELSVDEAIAAGATRVEFSQPVAFYVDNFLDFPLPTSVPAGYYDRDFGAWVASESGTVLDVLGSAGGLALIDVDGDGVPETPEQLATHGITEGEREALAQHYGSTPASLWRIEVSHFTPWDLNWGIVPPPGRDGARRPSR